MKYTNYFSEFLFPIPQSCTFQIKTRQKKKLNLKTSMVLIVTQSKYEANRSKGSLVIIKQTNKHQKNQINRDYYFIYLIRVKNS